MRFNRASVPTGLAILVAGVGLGGCMSTSTYGTGEAPEMAMFREITGGIGAKKREPIDYQPRAPLVMPPSADLRTPVEGAQVANANWPVDPDKTPKASKFDEVEMTPQKRAEIAAIAAEMPEVERRPRRLPSSKSTYDAIANRESNKQFSAALSEAKGSTCGERQYLTQPPSQYCQPAATAPQTFEGIDEKKSGGFFSRIF